MAADKNSSRAAVLKAATAALTHRARSELASRRSAARKDQAQATTLLSPDDVAGGYDAGRALYTSLGGELRPLTTDDLERFRRFVSKLGKEYHGGITAQSVIDRSTPVDRARANREIKTAIPAWARRGRIHFVTNSGPHSDVRRHNVEVVLVNHDKAVASPSSPTTAARNAVKGRLRFDCDCGRHRYWYSYIATIGQFNAGAPQTNYPKIRNPQLVGVGCKHVLRVMKQLNTAVVVNVVQRMIEADRRSLTLGRAPAVKLTEKQAQVIATQQHAENSKRTNNLVSARTRKAREKLKQNARSKAIEHAAKIGKTVKPDRAMKQAIARVQALAREQNITAAQLSKLMSAMKKTA